MVPTDHPKILRARDSAASEHSGGDVAELIRASRENRSAGEIRRLIARLVPEYSGNLDTGEFDTVRQIVIDEDAVDEETGGRPSAIAR
jgi:hypothetical protein